MNSQFRKFCLPKVKLCRSVKTKNKRRSELQNVFFGQYVIKSEIYNPEQVRSRDMSKMSNREYDNLNDLSNIEGGKYHTQVTTGLYLE